MSHHLDHQKNREQEVRARQAMEIQTSLFKRALRQALDHPETRLILWEFLQQMGWDQSPFSGNGPAQAHAIGKQDAARWWLNAIREHCPEREQQIRNEGVARDKQAKNTAITEEESE